MMLTVEFEGTPHGRLAVTGDDYPGNSYTGLLGYAELRMSSGAMVRLQAYPDWDGRFGGWSSIPAEAQCEGAVCTVYMTGNKKFTVRFDPK